MLETDADVRRGSYRARLMEQLQRASVQMKMHAVISSPKNKEEERAQDELSNKTFIILDEPLLASPPIDCRQS